MMNSSDYEISFLDLSLQHKPLKEEIMAALESILLSGNFILDETVATFEKDIAQYCGTKFAIGVNSGTDAIKLSLKALNIGPGDEVVTTANSFIATMMAISETSATPVLVDIDETYNMDPSKIERVLSSNTKAILTVHYTGRLAKISEILAIGEKYGIPIVEDAAQAMGAEYLGKKAGSFGLLGCFSFFPTKTLGCCGDGGLITTNDEELDRNLRLLRNFGRESRDVWTITGTNSRLDTIQSAILLVKLKYLDSWNARRRHVAKYYNENLKEYCSVPTDYPGEKQVYHLYVIRLRDTSNSELQNYLQERGIDARIHYPIPMYLQKAYFDTGYRAGEFRETEAYSRESLSLPIFPELKEEQIEYVVHELRGFFERRC